MKKAYGCCEFFINIIISSRVIPYWWRPKKVSCLVLYIAHSPNPLWKATFVVHSVQCNVVQAGGLFVHEYLAGNEFTVKLLITVFNGCQGFGLTFIFFLHTWPFLKCRVAPMKDFQSAAPAMPFLPYLWTCTSNFYSSLPLTDRSSQWELT